MKKSLKFGLIFSAVYLGFAIINYILYFIFSGFKIVEGIGMLWGSLFGMLSLFGVLVFGVAESVFFPNVRCTMAGQCFSLFQRDIIFIISSLVFYFLVGYIIGLFIQKNEKKSQLRPGI